jgi:hypothetical protein
MATLPNSLLASCAPSTESSSPVPKSIIRKPERGMGFTIIGNGIELSCLIESTKDTNGNFAGEIFHPVDSSLHADIGLHLRVVKFIPALGQNTQHFILPQKLPTAKNPNCSWALSMAEALSHPIGTWLTITSDWQSGIYHHDISDLTPLNSLEWQEFEQVLEAAFLGKIIDRLDHPVIERMQKKSTSPKNNFESFPYDL